MQSLNSDFQSGRQPLQELPVALQAKGSEGWT
jgi:hypothetical protein